MKGESQTAMPTDKTKIESILNTLEIRLDEYEKILINLQAIGHRLIDDTSPNKEGSSQEAKDPYPGQVSVFNRLNDRFDVLNNKFSFVIDKLQSII